MFAVINRLKAIPGYTHGTVVSVHSTEFDALIADAQLHRRHRKGSHSQKPATLVVLPLAVCRHQGEQIRVSDLVEGGESASNQIPIGASSKAPSSDPPSIATKQGSGGGAQRR